MSRTLKRVRSGAVLAMMVAAGLLWMEGVSASDPPHWCLTTCTQTHFLGCEYEGWCDGSINCMDYTQLCEEDCGVTFEAKCMAEPGFECGASEDWYKTWCVPGG